MNFYIVCSTTLVTVNSGIIKSYDYPSKYIKNKVECYWPIVAAKDQVVRLTAETLDLSGCENCGKLQVSYFFILRVRFVKQNK